MGALSRVLLEQYRCPEAFLNLRLTADLAADEGFFRFGPGIICYGRSSAGYRNSRVDAGLYDVAKDIVLGRSEVFLPFDPTEIIENLRVEHYTGAHDSKIRAQAREAYYWLRPVLHGYVRRQVQRLQLRGWRELQFPAWPVDRTVENISERVMLLALEASNAERIPFIWFWPHRASSCLVMTHDVESESGCQFCAELMDIDDSFGIRASFQLVPERRYRVSPGFLETIRGRGFEIAIQDLNHDGRLFSERKEFLRRAKLINKYAKAYGATGFRAAVLYRKPHWYDAFEFSFDMSIPNTARLDPQRGGCCTIMPYFIGNVLELPVTTTQDYMLFHLLGQQSIDLWKRQVELIAEKNGLISFIVHPDYVMTDELKSIYRDLLSYLREMRGIRNIWMTLPSAVDHWWRARSKMHLVPSGNEWRIEGEGADRAVVAYAMNVNGKLVYEFASAAQPRTS